MMFVSGLDPCHRRPHFRPRAAMVPGGLSGAGGYLGAGRFAEAHKTGRLTVETDPSDRRVTVTWSDRITARLSCSAIGVLVMAASSWARIVRFGLRRTRSPGEPAMPGAPGRRDAVEKPQPAPASMTAALDAFFTSSPGTYGVLIGTPERVLLERYSPFGPWIGRRQAGR